MLPQRIGSFAPQLPPLSAPVADPESCRSFSDAFGGSYEVVCGPAAPEGNRRKTAVATHIASWKLFR